ncbi:MAG: branched-chain amino acid ABC transporter permease [Thermoleophilia bacterium]|nr:branched-chain amino acid ABC transporter permease [Thermoleophilia bacterium]
MAHWFQLIVTGITMGSIYALIGLGYVTIYRTSHIVNMAQGSFVMVGAFFAFSFLNECGLPYWAGIILSILAVVAMALVMYVVVLKPIMRTSFVNMILATVGLSILVESVALIKWGGYPKSIPTFTGDKLLWIGGPDGVAIAPQDLWVIGLMLAIFVGLYILSSRTRVGKQMTATATNPNAARMSGISTNRMIMLAFAISAAVAAVGGLAIGSLVPVTYTVGGVWGLNGFVGAILGGWGSSGGAVIGGLALGIIQSLSTGFMPAGYQDAIAFALLILILYFRPQGILGTTMAEGEA